MEENLQKRNPLDFFSNRKKIAFWSAFCIAAIEIARQYLLGDYQETRSAAADFAAVWLCNWLIWQFNFFVDDYQQGATGYPSWKLVLFRVLLIFSVGTAIVLIIESIVHHYFRAEGDIWFYFLRGIFHNGIILVIYYAMQLQRRHRDIAIENAQLKEENVHAQLDLLRQQVNPHFLFNALNTLKSMVKSGDPNSTDFIVHLAEVYRYLLQSNPNPIVTVAEELGMLRAYSFLLQQRFGESFRLEIDLPENVFSTQLPPLTLQLLTENAIKHNITSLNKPLRIRIFCPDEGHIAVQNNFQPRKSVEKSTGTGLENINHRYKLLTGQEIRIEQQSGNFTVFLPLITPSNDTYENTDRGR